MNHIILLFLVSIIIIYTFAENTLIVMIDINDILKSKDLAKTDMLRKMGFSRESIYCILSGNPTLDNITFRD